MHGWGVFAKLSSILFLCLLSLGLAMTADCSGHGQPSCDGDGDGEVDEDYILDSPLSYNSQIRVPILSILSYDVTAANLGNSPLENATVSLDLPSNWEYDGPAQLGTLERGQAKRTRFHVLVSEDLTPTQELTIIFTDTNGEIARGTATVRVEIPTFAVRIKPSLDNYESQNEGEVYVLLNNKEGKSVKDLEVEVNVNLDATTSYVQYLGVFGLKPYAKFRYRYTYPIAHLEEPALVQGWLRQDGSVIAESDDTISTVYHPSRFDKDARTLQQIS